MATRCVIRVIVLLTLVFLPAPPTTSQALPLAALVDFSAAGANPAAIQPTVDAFRTALGGAINPNVAGSFPAGRREINWDGVPDAFSAPNALPANFFNVNSPRGVIFSGAGATFQVSANAPGQVRFDHINATYSAQFQTFSPQRLFSAIGTNVYDVTFFVPGSNVPAYTTAFGAVFTDVDLAATTSIEFFDPNNVSLGSRFAQTAASGLSFVGVTTNAGEKIGKVRITQGNAALGPNESGGLDLVVADDFIYAEPQPVQAVTSASTGANPAAIQTTVDAFRTALGTLNSNVVGSFGNGRREVNWDGVPDASAAPNNLPANFFNLNSPRGVVFAAGGSNFQVSANTGVAPVRFDTINATYSGQFQTFSPQRLFTAVTTTTTDVSFFVPGTDKPAYTTAFGVVFTDAELAGKASIEPFDVANASLGKYHAPVTASGGLSFIAIRFTGSQQVGKVRITSGDTPLGPNETAGIDLVVMDDFIYAEPQPLPTTPAAGTTPAGNVQFVRPFRVLDTRAGTTIGFDQAGNPITARPFNPNETRQFKLAGKTFPGGSLPTGITGILANITIVHQNGPSGGFVTVFPGNVPRPNASTTNPSTAVGIDFNFWTTGVAPDGTINVFSTNQLDVLIDVVGYFSLANPTLGNPVFVNPIRVVDTRPDATPTGPIGIDGTTGVTITAGTLPAATSRRFRIAGQTFPGGAIPAGVTGLYMNVTIVQGGPSGGYITVYPADGNPKPDTSTVNPSTAIAFNGWASGLPTSGNTGQLEVWATQPMHLIIDVVGFYQPSAPFVGSLSFITPNRMVDTRPTGNGIVTTGFDQSGNAITAAPFNANETRRYTVAGKTFSGFTYPTGTRAVLASATIVGQAGGGFVTIFPGNVADANRPLASTVNPSTGIDQNFFAVGVSQPPGTNPGTIAVFSTNPLDVAIDVLAIIE